MFLMRAELKSSQKVDYPLQVLPPPPKRRIGMCAFPPELETHSSVFQDVEKKAKLYNLQFTAHKLPLIVLPCKLDTLRGSIKLFITKHLRFRSDNLHIIRQKPTLVSSSMASSLTDDS